MDFFSVFFFFLGFNALTYYIWNQKDSHILKMEKLKADFFIPVLKKDEAVQGQ